MIVFNSFLIGDGLIFSWLIMLIQLTLMSFHKGPQGHNELKNYSLNKHGHLWQMLIHLPLNKMATISQTIFSEAFL